MFKIQNSNRANTKECDDSAKWFVTHGLLRSNIFDQLFIYIHKHLNIIKSMSELPVDDDWIESPPPEWELTKSDILSILKKLQKLN